MGSFHDNGLLQYKKRGRTRRLLDILASSTWMGENGAIMVGNTEARLSVMAPLRTNLQALILAPKEERSLNLNQRLIIRLHSMGRHNISGGGLHQNLAVLIQGSR
jgi:hypothetical protein